MERSKYYTTTKSYEATALAFIGFKYMKFQESGRTIYRFDNTQDFSEALGRVLALRGMYNTKQYRDNH